MPVIAHLGSGSEPGDLIVDAAPVSRKRFGPRRTAVLLTLLLFLVVLMFVFSSDFIPSRSMEPNLKPGDHVLTTRAWFSYPMNAMPARGDIITFRMPLALLDEPEPKQALALNPDGSIDGSPAKLNFTSFFSAHDKMEVLIKRVIGLPGETVFIKGNAVYINGRLLKEDYKTIPPDSYSLATASYAVNLPFKVPQGELFVLGDNRQNSEDGRYWGALPRRYVIGRFHNTLYNEGTAGPNILRTQDGQ